MPPRGPAWERNLRCAKVTSELLVLPARLGTVTAGLGGVSCGNDPEGCAFSFKRVRFIQCVASKSTVSKQQRVTAGRQIHVNTPGARDTQLKQLEKPKRVSGQEEMP